MATPARRKVGSKETDSRERGIFFFFLREWDDLTVFAN